MKIAVTYQNDEVFQHFGKSKAFKLYEVEDGKVCSGQVVDTEGKGHGDLAGFLKDKGVEALICGGIGGGARTALAEAGIKLYPGVSGKADQQVQKFADNCLEFDAGTQCNHHGEGHTCHH